MKEKDIDILKKEIQIAIDRVDNLSLLEKIRIKYLGKNGCLKKIIKNLLNLSIDQRPIIGNKINKIKNEIEILFLKKKNFLKKKELLEKLSTEYLDISLSGRNNHCGSFHPITQVKHMVYDYFSYFGFDFINGPEIETKFYNFEALNISNHHPACTEQDTFYINNSDKLLRTHTTTIQIRMIENCLPPLRLISLGKVYRKDFDRTHTPMFHQVEGLWIDKSINLSNLKWLLEDFFNYFFKKKIVLRFRSSYFPFTEPSAEMDIRCINCSGAGCKLCKFIGWIEVLGCGLVHPNILNNINSAFKDYQGLAFGIGLDRLAMLYFRIDDIRIMFENDLSFLRQFI
ncbi:phenylalanine--tRNA ligase subunit alpha [Candidatus Legionella polyplacis]|uniref:Phenylalanine--tRNA ligase alpha subunit n=1 Tax=Candidatus Legionella polyplacis TaxID=2005262 RepID=A0ABZ2GYU6_9GAMM